jgi:CHAT domain-containing protein/tetratricopeptide (TPR) repeat protein
MPDDPYVGPRPFEKGDRRIFFARYREANELLSLVTAHPAVLLYARSGAGKSSLLNAGLIPLLEEDGFQVLPTARVHLAVSAGSDPTTLANVFAYSILLSLGAQDPHRPLEEHLARPAVAGYEEPQLPRVVIIDQFEELFTAFPERWRDRQALFEQLGGALAQDSRLRLVLAMREDYIAELDPYVSALPEKLRTRFRLEPLRESGALEAVTGPLRNRPRQFATGVAESLVTSLLAVKSASGERVRGEFVEPVQLQVVCRKLWRSLEGTASPAITHEDVLRFGDVDQALAEFYEQVVRDTSAKHGLKEGFLRRWFEQVLITPLQTRGSVFQGRDATGGVPNSVVADLEREHLITGERRGRARWYELTHDRLIEPIRASNQAWLLARSGSEQTRRRLEERAARWADRGRSADEHLDEGELTEAERWLGHPDAAELGFSEQLRSFVAASRSALEAATRRKELAQVQALMVEQQKRADAEEQRAREQQRRAEAEAQRAQEQQQKIEVQRRGARLLRRGLVLLGALLLVVMCVALFAIRERARAQSQAGVARLAGAREAAQRRIADEQRAVAEKLRDRAVTTAMMEEKLAVAASKATAGEAAQRKRAELAFAAAQRARQVVEQQRASLATALSQEKAAHEEAIVARKQAEAEQAKAITTLSELNASLHETADAKTAAALSREAAGLYKRGDLERAVEIHEEALRYYHDTKDRKGEADTNLRVGQIQSDLNRDKEALIAFQRALELFVASNNPAGEAEVLASVGGLDVKTSSLAEALTSYDQSLALYRRIGDRSGQARALQARGEIFHALGRTTEASRDLEESLLLARNSGSRNAEIAALRELGEIYREAGELQRSLSFQQRSLLIASAAEDRVGQAQTLVGLGKTLRLVGDRQAALDHLSQALQIFVTLNDRSGMAVVLNDLGGVYEDLGDNERARQNVQEALVLSRAIGNRRSQTTALRTLGHLDVALGRSEEARGLFREALSMSYSSGDLRSELSVLIDVGEDAYRHREYSQAAEMFERALGIAQTLLDRSAEASARHGMARVRREEGRLDEAENYCQVAVEIMETLRASIASPSLRDSFSGSVREYYDTYIDILMLLHWQRPKAGFANRALEASERSRARGLLDALTEDFTALLKGADPTSLERERSLSTQLNEKASLRYALRSQPKSSDQLALLDKDIDALISDYHSVEAQLRAGNPRWTELARPRSLSVSEIQRGLLDKDTVMLEFHLGMERSYLWAVTSDEAEVFKLPSRGEINKMLYDYLLLSLTSDREANVSVSEKLLRPASLLLTRPRLVIIPDGRLSWLPFAALLDPTSPPGGFQPLVISHEIVLAPSASVLAQLRRRKPQRSSNRALAVVGDPVSASGDLPTSQKRTPGMAREVEALAFLAQLSREVKIAVGHNANRSLVISGELRQYSILHFSNNVFLDTKHPELSSLVLSPTEIRGRSIPGLVNAYEIKRLALSADLVVLSGSTIGKGAIDEGSIGLASAFLEAGVPAVVGSLWSVDDFAVAELMTLFYRHLLKEGMSPSKALSTAQSEMQRSARWSASSYWAGFILQGDWR